MGTSSSGKEKKQTRVKEDLSKKNAGLKRAGIISAQKAFCKKIKQPISVRSPIRSNGVLMGIIAVDKPLKCLALCCHVSHDIMSGSSSQDEPLS